MTSLEIPAVSQSDDPITLEGVIVINRGTQVLQGLKDDQENRYIG